MKNVDMTNLFLLLHRVTSSPYAPESASWPLQRWASFKQTDAQPSASTTVFSSVNVSVIE